MIDQMRDEFEEVFSQPPYEFDMERFSGEDSAWPGCYVDYSVECAWCGWEEAMRRKK